MATMGILMVIIESPPPHSLYHYSMATMDIPMAIKLPVQSPPPHSRHRIVQLCLLLRPSNPRRIGVQFRYQS